eukprot:CAMPEP_0185763016 /NCGR_PEP_ID=MMETSP1174-20130828/21971_1 /TAXON_ID=35687 /ORGANISM="Dictyocha speculum, Strain CCMP1381" /LENGTH=62 /DNA_ID=CAMNT_0028444933 /DNA_START=100 /DNA_END=284 /DNA_ORIENTATION=+
MVMEVGVCSGSTRSSSAKERVKGGVEACVAAWLSRVLGMRIGVEETVRVVGEGGHAVDGGVT